MSDAYSVVVTGKIASGFELAQVKQDVGRLFKLKEQQLDKLFSGKPVAIKRDLDKGQALKMRAALAKTGALAAVTISKPVVVPAVTPSASPSITPTATPSTTPSTTPIAPPQPVEPSVANTATIEPNAAAVTISASNNKLERISCPRCGHEQAYSNNCGVCQVDLRLQRKRVQRKQQLQAMRGKSQR